MRDVLPRVTQWAARGDRVALATVVDVRRSAPRPPGAKMAVNEHGEIAGAVSGGCVEGAVVEIADRVIRGEAPRLTHFGIAAVIGLERVVVVLGANAAGIMARVDFLCAEPMICEDWREGMAASLRCGVAALDGAERVIVTLGDQPLVTPGVIARFLEASPGTRATYDGRPGHPVVLGPEQLRAIALLRGDSGARELLGDAPAIECAELCCGRDVDTPEDLEAVRDELARSSELRPRRAGS